MTRVPDLQLSEKNSAISRSAFRWLRLATLATVATAGTLAWVGPASANVEFARMTGRGCSSCHAADRTPSRETVNAVGSGFNSCHLDPVCIRQWRESLPPEAPVGQRRFYNGVPVTTWSPPPPRYPPND